MLEITRDIVLEDAPATASIGGRRYYAYLPGGYLWQLVEAYFYMDTGQTAGGANCWLWKLYRGSDDTVMATVSGGSALIQYNAMTLSTTAGDLICDASPTNPAVFYAACVNSGAGQAMAEGMRICTRWKAVKPGVGA